LEKSAIFLVSVLMFIAKEREGEWGGYTGEAKD
jgi:hypothetical protein